MPPPLPRRPVSAREFEAYQIPASWRSEQFLDAGAYYIIPTELLTRVVLAVGQNRIRNEDIRRETELFEAADQRVENIAIRDGGLISFDDIAPWTPFKLAEYAVDELHKNPAEAAHFERMTNERLKVLGVSRRAYLGWLLTNPIFVDEHDALLHQHAAEYQRCGFPEPMLSASRSHDANAATAWARDACAFYARWRLQSMALPYLPRPLPYLVPDIFAAGGFAGAEGMATASLPDIYPTLGRSVHDDLLADARPRGHEAEHLAEWYRLIHRSTTTKMPFRTYDRWLRLQHYWRLLHRRFPEAVHRRKERLVDAFAAYFQVSRETVKSDLLRISKRLGPHWECRFVNIP